MKKLLSIMILVIISSVSIAQWKSQSSNALRSIFFINNNIGWVVGNNGIIQKTTDGGNCWLTQKSGTISTLTSVCFVNENLGWIVGYNGIILTTTDGGSKWDMQNCDTDKDLGEVTFLDPQIGWAVYCNGAGLLKTTNGGIKWQVLNSGATWWLKTIKFINAETGWIGGDGPTIRKTTNGGNSWFELNTTLTSDVVISNLFFKDAQHGWAVGGNYNGSGKVPSESVILRTEDGGTTWTRIVVDGITNHLTYVYFIDNNTGWISGFDGVILKTTDGGITWSVSNTAKCENLNCIFFIDSNTGWTVDDGSSIFKTTNGGGTSSIKRNDGQPGKLNFELKQNFPNPFNPETTIEYQVSNLSDVQLKIFDSNGKLVNTLIDKKMDKGSYSVNWNGKDAAGNTLASGTYYYQVIIDNNIQTKKMVYLK